MLDICKQLLKKDFGEWQPLYGPIDKAFVDLFGLREIALPTDKKARQAQHVMDALKALRSTDIEPGHKKYLEADIGQNHANFSDEVVKFALLYRIDVEDAAALLAENEKFIELQKHMPACDAIDKLGIGSNRAKKEAKACRCVMEYYEELKKSASPNFEIFLDGTRFEITLKEKGKEIARTFAAPTSGEIYLSCLSVLNAKKRHKGYGTALLTEVKKLFLGHEITLCVENHNKAAIKCYEKNGFTRVKGGEEVDFFKMSYKDALAK